MRSTYLLFICFIAIHVLIAYLLPSNIPSRHFPYDEILARYYFHPPFTAFANFDGYQYISIAHDGYNQLQQSFFPLYPTLISYANNHYFKNYIFAGLFISWASLFLGIIFFKKLTDQLLKDKKQSMWSLFFLLAFPASFFYQVIYTDSLFLFLSTASLYCLIKKKKLFAVFFVFLASLTKIQGVLLIIPFFLLTFDLRAFKFKNFTLRNIADFLRRKYLMILFVLSPLSGLIVYMIHLYDFYKDPLYFYHAQAAFGAHRTSSAIISIPQVLYRYLKIFFTADYSFSYWIALLEFATFLLVGLILLYDLYNLLKKSAKDMPQIAINLYSLSAVILPTMTGTLSSFPRYALISLSFFIALAKSTNIILKITLILIFSALQLLTFIFFLKGYFIS